MLRLLSIEFYKLKHSRYFWFITAAFLLFLIAVPVGVKSFLDFLTREGDKIVDLGVSPSDLPLFDFVDLWQNMTWFYKFFSLFLGFITILSVGNEFSYGTLKQNVIDGMSRREFLWSKLLMIAALSIGATIAVFLVGLVVGFMWSPVTEAGFIFKHIEFLPAYCLHLFAFQTLCLVVTLLIKRSGIALAVMVFYVYVVEMIGAGIIEFHYRQEWLANLLPIRALNNFIPNPFPKYLLRETVNYIPMAELGTTIGYLLVLLWIADRLVTRRDLG